MFKLFNPCSLYFITHAWKIEGLWTGYTFSCSKIFSIFGIIIYYLKNENTHFKSASKALCQLILCLLNCWVFFSYYPKSHYCVEMTTCMQQPNNSCKLLSGSVISSKLALKNVALLYLLHVSTCMGCVHYIWSKVANKIWNIQDLNRYINLKVCFFI